MKKVQGSYNTAVWDRPDGPSTLPPGTFAYEAKKRGMIYICPCGCGAEDYLDFRSIPETHPSWIWDGNIEKPTLTPSIYRKTACGWHGYLRAGIWESL